MKKYWIKDLTEKQAIHVPTHETAEKLCERLDELGLKWWDGDSLWKFGENSCYNPKSGELCSKSYCEKEEYEVITIGQLLDFDELLKIEAGKYYKSRAGHRVQIYNVNAGGSRPIHGALEDTYSNWIIHSWDEGGVYNNTLPQSPLDIIGEWKDGIEFDVEILPKWKYLAMDLDGAWFVYFAKPKKLEDVWFLSSDSPGQYLDKKDCPKNYKGSWEDSLHKIVDGRLIRVKNKI